jgi:hypothetical protein
MNFLEKEDGLPQTIKDFFRSADPGIELEKACFIYGIAPNEISKLSGSIGLIFVSDLRLSELPHVISENIHLNVGVTYGIAFEINKRIFNRFPEYFQDSISLLDQWEKLKTSPVLTEEEAQKKVLEIEPWLLEKDDAENEEREETRKYQETLSAMPLIDALKKYSEIAEQIITSQPILTASSPDPVRPSIKNWISDYTFNLGYEMHSSIARGNYMFQGENTKKLNTEDREKLSYILKAFDEKTPITVNASTKQIVFPVMAPTPAPVSRPETKPRMDNLSGPEIKKETTFKIAPTQRMNFQSTPAPISSPKTTTEMRPAQDTNLKFTSTQKMPFEYEREKIQGPEPTKPKPPVQSPPLNHPQFLSPSESLRSNEMRANDSDVRVPHPDIRRDSETLTRKEPQPQKPITQPEIPARPQTHPLRISSHQKQEPERMQPLPRNVVNLKE